MLHEELQVSKQSYGPTTNAVTKCSVSVIINLCCTDGVRWCSVDFVSGSNIKIKNKSQCILQQK